MMVISPRIKKWRRAFGVFDLLSSETSLQKVCGGAPKGLLELWLMRNGKQRAQINIHS